MRPAVFIGPSLDRESAARELDAEYLPPVARGDIEDLLGRATPPRAIGIVDGRFLDSLSISPKEVLRAVDAGIPVYGSSSMGALRAVECAPFGMIGVGRIYEAYATGAVDADDEVAIVYHPESLRAQSEPLINLRFAVEHGVERAMIEAQAAQRFLNIAKSLYFPDRTVAAVLRILRKEIGDTVTEAFADFFANHAPDTKREDALELLARIRHRMQQPKTVAE
ncbi:TfuA-like protein [Streptomyces sp. NPDC014940]|uniref:TfuA-like protein n=1 Tax=Streptomyces sp. NPDC014940 TaxID=3364932 RepID=UPI0036FB5ED0